MLLKFFWGIFLVLVILPPLDTYFDDSMTRLMLVQTPILVILGALVPSLFNLKRKLTAPWGLSLLFIALAMVMFWMTPRSLDLAVVEDQIDAFMHLTLLLSGFLLRLSLSSLPLLIQMATGIYVTSMAGSFGVILSQTTARICARFDIFAQQETGVALLWATITFLILHVAWSMKNLVQMGPKDQDKEPLINKIKAL